MSLFRTALWSAAAVALGACASAPAERPELAMSVDEIVTRTALGPSYACPVGTVEHCRSGMGRLDSHCTCTPERILAQQLGMRY